MSKSLSSVDEKPDTDSTGHIYSNNRLIVPYVLPYAAYVAIASLFDFLGPSLNYAIRIAVVTSILWWAWPWYVPFRGPGNTLISVLIGIVFGIVGILLWIVLMSPFAEPSQSSWDNVSFAARVSAATLLVPLFEELLMRGFVLRIAHQWVVERKNNTSDALERVIHEKSVNSFKPGDWSPFAIFFSSAVFMMGHRLVEWPAAFVYGALLGVLWIVRKDLISCICAHATSNLALGGFVYVTGSYEYW